MSRPQPRIADLRSGRSAIQRWPLVAVYLAIAYWLAERELSGWISSPNINYYLVQPLLWLGLGVLAYTGWRRMPGARPVNLVFVAAALLIGIVHVAVLVVAGLVGGMTEVRQGFDLLVFVEDTWYVGSVLIGLEMARGFLYEAWAKHSVAMAAAVTAIVFFVAATPYARLTSLADRPADSLGESLLPGLAISLLSTWFVVRGGMGTSLAYRAPIQAFFWYSVVLPDLHWSTTLAVGMTAPVIGYMLAQPVYDALATGRGRDPGSW